MACGHCRRCLTTATNGALQDWKAHPVDLSPYILAPVPPLDAGNALRNAGLHLSGPFISAPGGEVYWTAAVERRTENIGSSVYTVNQLDPTDPTVAATYNFVAPRFQHVNSQYIEARIPFIGKKSPRWYGHSFDLQVAFRNEQYTTRSTRTIPTSPSPYGPFAPVTYATNNVSSGSYTLGLRYEPIKDLLVRASLGTGFLPPTLNQLNPTNGALPASLFSRVFQVGGDPARGNQPLTGDSSGRISYAVGGNPNLEPEKSKSWSAGVVFRPRWMPGLRLSLDYTSIEKSGEITNLLPAFFVANAGSFSNRITRGANLPGDPSGYLGPITAIDYTAINLAHTSVSACDMQIDYEFETNIGRFDAYAVGTRAITFVSPHYRDVAVHRWHWL